MNLHLGPLNIEINLDYVFVAAILSKYYLQTVSFIIGIIPVDVIYLPVQIRCAHGDFKRLRMSKFC